MKRTEHCFAIHDLLRIRISDTIGLWDRLFMRPLRGYVHYQVTAKDDFEPDLDIEIGPFEHARRPAVRVDRRFQIGPGVFFTDDTYKILWWRVAIENWESPEPVHMRIHRNAFGTAAIGSRLIDCMVRYLLNRKGAPAVHACGVVNTKGAAVLLSGRSGVGKSTIAMRLLAQGYKLLGDNWTIVNRHKAQSLHTPVNVYDYNVAPELLARMPGHLRLDMRWKAIMRELSGGYLKKSTCVILRDAFPNLVAEEASLGRILTFSQGRRFSVARLNSEQCVGRLVANDMMDRDAFYRYMLAYNTVFPTGEVSSHWTRLRRNLTEALEGVEAFDIVVPGKISSAVVQSIRELAE